MDKNEKMGLVDQILKEIRESISGDYADGMGEKSPMQLVKDAIEALESYENKPWSEED